MTRELDVGQSALLTDLAMCINYYRLFSPGLYCCTLVPVQFDPQTRFTPGVMVMVNYGQHKQCAVDDSQLCFNGPPNFVLDVFPGDDWLDYEYRRASCERTGVVEYVAVQDTESPQWIWNRLIEGRYSAIESDDPGFIRSAALPGLWIPTQALADRDWWTILASIARGVTRLPHHHLMDTIWRPTPQDA
jgi:hypothetical protein